MESAPIHTQPFCAGDVRNARVLVIGHDPRLQSSGSLAEYAFFADYFFRPEPAQASERAKYQLAEAVYGYVNYLTGNCYGTNELVLTNLCNLPLPHAPRFKTAWIPEAEAQAGLDAIRAILDQSSIELVFAMSQQVNYWLQKLGFYPAMAVFLERAEPLSEGLQHDPPYYEPTKSRAFQLICGQCYSDGQRAVVPILHVKNWPLKGRFAAAYGMAYRNLIYDLKHMRRSEE